ncbi:hypothetical protein MSG28_004846 [Choristoneura fumiferana]|uniref:Uncharacterized protein n=1 Tax=Choristoneura fumiferana TaxID=7141 RepID=A0ACC0K7L4_CHOFU|nr:hypothetical protein MSG28_004846 [Choristoneura fumiferana]
MDANIFDTSPITALENPYKTDQSKEQMALLVGYYVRCEIRNQKCRTNWVSLHRLVACHSPYIIQHHSAALVQVAAEPEQLFCVRPAGMTLPHVSLRPLLPVAVQHCRRRPTSPNTATVFNTAVPRRLRRLSFTRVQRLQCPSTPDWTLPKHLFSLIIRHKVI